MSPLPAPAIARSIGMQNQVPRELSNRAIDFGWGRLETVTGLAGNFPTVLTCFVLVFSQCQSETAAVLGGGSTNPALASQPRLSILHPGTPFEWCFAAPSTYEILLLAPDFVAITLLEDAGISNLQLPEMSHAPLPPLVNLLLKKLRTAAAIGGQGSHLTAETLARLILVAVIEPTLGRHRPQLDPAIARAVAYIRTHIAHRLDLGSIAAVAGLSVSQLCRTFRAAMGQSVHQYILEQRVDEARRRLHSTRDTLSQIAHDCGFSSQSHFTTVFRHRFGTTPKQYRLQSGQGDARSG